MPDNEIIYSNEIIDRIAEAKDKFDSNNDLYDSLFKAGVVGFLIDCYRIPGKDSQSALIKLFGDVAYFKEEDLKMATNAEKVESTLVLLASREETIKKNLKSIANNPYLLACNNYANGLLTKVEASNTGSYSMFRR